jgi:hypothetical protein
MLGSHLLFCFLKSPLKAIFQSLSTFASILWCIYSGNIDLRSLLPHNCFVEIVVVVSPPLRVDERI